MELFGYIAAIGMGFVLGLIGGGGSILTVPILVYIFALDASIATAYSLFVVGIASAVGAWTYWRKQQIDFKTGIWFAVPAFVGVYFSRRFVVPMLPQQMGSFLGIEWTKDNLILIVFGGVMLAAAVMILKSPKFEKTNVTDSSSTGVLILLEGFLVGSLTGFVGAGGGFLIIPALVLLRGLEMKMAIGTSLFIIAIKSLIGFIGDVQSQALLDWEFLGYFTAFTLVGILLGTSASKKTDGNKLKRGFGVFVLLMSVFIVAKEIFF